MRPTGCRIAETITQKNGNIDLKYVHRHLANEDSRLKISALKFHHFGYFVATLIRQDEKSSIGSSAVCHEPQPVYRPDETQFNCHLCEQ
jgi:hypothetical protein